MKSFKLLYPPHSVINLLLRLLRIKKFEIISINEETGEINALKKRRFQKDLLLYIRVSKHDNSITNLELTVSLKSKFKNKPLENAEGEEEALLNSIDNYF